tara:strand:- start:561 stop:1022 length:462 start_codon:yes stop_codon:yes gene_type:complete
MLRKILLISVMGLMLTGCYMAPMALIGPATSGFTTASIVQSGISTGASFIVKKSTGKTISEHVRESFEKDVFQQSYAPNKENYLKTQKIDLGTKVESGCKKFDFYCQRKLTNKSNTKLIVPKNVYKINVGCKRFDYYCKRMSEKVLAPSFNLN